MRKSASAGFRGPEVRSDVWIEIEPRARGGIEIELKSKVASLYGSSIRRQVAGGCQALGLPHGKVTLEDQGALPFVLDARLEAAWRRLGGGEPERPLLPELFRANDKPSAKDRFRRSRHYLPGTEPKFMTNAALHQPDCVILDLEDSVAPSEKDAARVLVRNALRFLDWGACERMVRINQLPLGLEDLPFAVGHGAQAIVVPKVESAEEVVRVAEEAARLSAKAAFGAPPWIVPILESAAGVQAAPEIARAHPTVVALSIGLEDYTASIGAVRSRGGRESQWARSIVVAAARAAGVQPLDSVFSDVDDLEGLAASVEESKSMGFEGSGSIHPRQIATIHDGYGPSAEELVRAKAIVRAYEEAASRGIGVVALGSKMIDPPVVKRAERSVELAVRTGKLPRAWRESDA